MANATNAGMPVKVGDVEYEFSPINVEDLEYFELWLKSQAIQAGRMSIPEDASPAEHARMLQEVITASNSINIFEDGAFDRLMTPGGLIRILHRMVCKKHPEIKLEHVKQWLHDRELVQNLLPVITAMVQVTVKRGTHRKSRKRRSPTPTALKRKRSKGRT